VREKRRKRHFSAEYFTRKHRRGKESDFWDRENTCNSLQGTGKRHHKPLCGGIHER
jgi:hypothetical protein